jgi:hypothetical protein
VIGASGLSSITSSNNSNIIVDVDSVY